jgi:cysteine-rich repeat protein
MRFLSPLLVAPLATLALAVAGCPDGTTPDDTGTRDTSAPRDAGRDSGVITLCGNGTIDTSEECDGTNLHSETCITQGHAGGTLSCSALCQFNETACTANPCGNGTLDTGESCDGTALNGATCVSEGFLRGALACAADCTFNTTACDACGDGNIDAGELCDGTDLHAETCATRGFTGGTLACTALCAFNTAACVNSLCGNGALDTGEDCDGAMTRPGNTCATFGFATGTLSCNADCTANTSLCTRCGNAMIDGTEACDGAALGGRTCVTEGFSAGTLACSPTCALNTTGCTVAACGNGLMEAGEACDDGNALAADGCGVTCMVEAGYACAGTPSSCDPVCGDAMIVGAETCDGANLGGFTCATVGFPMGGTLLCSPTCRLDSTSCASGPCGNGTVDPTEECDDANHLALDGCDAACRVEASFNLPVRITAIAGALVGTRGRVEVRFGTGWRDVCDDGLGSGASTFANVVCRQLGYTGTGHSVFTAGGGSETPVMDNVTCTGTEPNLSQCVFNGWGVENCVGAEAIGVECMPGEGDVRLAGGLNSMVGRLQVFHAGAWGEVCDDYLETSRYGITTACQQLGYAHGANTDAYPAPNDTFALDDVSCVGTERRLSSCPHSAYGVENCRAFEAQGIVCAELAEGDLRIVGGTGRNDGRVEVLHSNAWGTVCDDGLEFNPAMPPPPVAATRFATVSCRQLGFTSGGPLLSGSVPDGTAPIVLDDLMCVGTEAALLSCPARPHGTHNCGHNEDVGIHCIP